MTNPDELLNGYLDRSLTPEQHEQLQCWLAQSPENIRRFTELLLFDSQLRNDALLIKAGLTSASIGSAASHQAYLQARSFHK